MKEKSRRNKKVEKAKHRNTTGHDDITHLQSECVGGENRQTHQRKQNRDPRNMVINT